LLQNLLPELEGPILNVVLEYLEHEITRPLLHSLSFLHEDVGQVVKDGEPQRLQDNELDNALVGLAVFLCLIKPQELLLALLNTLMVLNLPHQGFLFLVKILHSVVLDESLHKLWLVRKVSRTILNALKRLHSLLLELVL